ncbi:MAG: CBS domain containing-hemolysin-like protein [Alphaproteobacteria bacterium]|jgi:CBS domain containing-hemolysin-like protein
MRTLDLFDTESLDQLVWPDDEQALSMTSSALLVFTDFKMYRPLIIDHSLKAILLEELMKKAQVRMKLVLNKERKFIGVVGYNDLSEQQVLKKATNGITREELLVSDFMTPKAKLKSFDYQQLSEATVGDVVRTLQNNGQQHCLVIDHQAHEIRGLISSTEIARKLRISLKINTQPSFMQLFNEIEA